VFVKRLKEELQRQGISINALSRREGAPKQRTLNDVVNGADPRLETVDQIATALGVPAWTLFVEQDQYTRRVVEFPTYPKVFNDTEPREMSRREAKKTR
jgi:transcriptional regulator with XRE-family HTH domain